MAQPFIFSIQILGVGEIRVVVHHGGEIHRQLALVRGGEERLHRRDLVL